MAASAWQSKCLLALVAALLLAEGERVEVRPEAAGLGPVAAEVAPCVDFYDYACQPWMHSHPIPADQSMWGQITALAEQNLTTLRTLLRELRPGPGPTGLEERQLANYYAACMDAAAIEAKGLAPLQPALGRIAALRQKGELAATLAWLHQTGIDALFAFSAAQDPADASLVIAQADQGGLGLPDRDYYLRQDAPSRELRRSYLTHVTRMFLLLGRSAQAHSDAAAVLRIETGLARAALDRVSRRDPWRTYHDYSTARFAALAPAFDWSSYLAQSGAPPFRRLNVAVPAFFRGLNTLIEQVDLSAWQAYLRWQLVTARASLLPKAFVEEDFAFYGRILGGARELRPRWKRCIELCDGDLGFALGRQYVKRTFGPAAKARTLEMVRQIERALAEDIRQRRWMSEQTKQRALQKLAAVNNNIGYPSKWRDYSSLSITTDDALGNHLRATRFEVLRVLHKIGKPVDRSEWQMTPSTVNAYYDPQLNSINFPAGILQPPFFALHRDAAVNYGAIGAVIGHELTHGFDDEGRRFDAHGNLRPWWTTEDIRAFNAHAQCFVAEYSSFTAVGDEKINGRLTLGENIADNGGVRLARWALLHEPATRPDALLGGLSADQRFFLAWGQVWCQNRTAQAARLAVKVDPHAPSRYRVNGVLSNLTEMAGAFRCSAAARMVRRPICRVW